MKNAFDEYFISLGVPDTWRATVESVWNAAYASGQKSKALVLPSEKSGEYWGKPPVGFADGVRAHNECLKEIKRLNPSATFKTPSEIESGNEKTNR